MRKIRRVICKNEDYTEKNNKVVVVAIDYRRNVYFCNWMQEMEDVWKEKLTTIWTFNVLLELGMAW